MLCLNEERGERERGAEGRKDGEEKGTIGCMEGMTNETESRGA